MCLVDCGVNSGLHYIGSIREELLFAAFNSIAKHVLIIIQISHSTLSRKPTFCLDGLPSASLCAMSITDLASLGIVLAAAANFSQQASTCISARDFSVGGTESKNSFSNWSTCFVNFFSNPGNRLLSKIWHHADLIWLVKGYNLSMHLGVRWVWLHHYKGSDTTKWEQSITLTSSLQILHDWPESPYPRFRIGRGLHHPW